MDVIYWILCLIALAFLSFQDYRTMQVSWFAVLLLSTVNVWHAFTSSQFVPNLTSAVIAFILLWLLAKLSDYQIGIGDVYIIAVIFLGIGSQLAMRILLISSSSVLLWALVICLLKKSHVRSIKQYNVPFLPFVTLSCLAVVCL